MPIVVFCPSRGRPDKAGELVETFTGTKRGRAWLVLVVDQDDPSRDGYLKHVSDLVEVVSPPHEGGGMVPPLNAAAMDRISLGVDRSTIFGFVGDDHRFRTEAWDLPIGSELGLHPGFAYANDLAQGEALPTQCFINATIVEALGWMAPPMLKHLYVDNSWKLLGDATDSLVYFPDLIIEHMHPFFGKAQMDEGYARVNDELMYERDRRAFEKWHGSDQYQEDVAKVRAAIGG